MNVAADCPRQVPLLPATVDKVARLVLGQGQVTWMPGLKGCSDQAAGPAQAPPGMPLTKPVVGPRPGVGEDLWGVIPQAPQGSLTSAVIPDPIPTPGPYGSAENQT